MRFADIPRDLRNALLATLFFGAASGIIVSVLNNYLSDVHGFGAAARGWLEFPREFLSLIHISEPTRPVGISRMPSSA